ncbi:hypothetical protein [Pseudothauera rhizosphaerae]|uniref:Uncharacterized protein n=1 Tax=Pseudothauera rhizosphaerae TaxID=2565932 RepID=A0A4S4AWA7_9RHOO|nr:hypothetical protein [Pseudothauera rhizosphaerae]THF64309.1 hypothetical protein E6O51_03080 [Pseudothauera rhizosphaerae]
MNDIYIFALIGIAFVAVFVWQRRKAREEKATDAAERAEAERRAREDYANHYANPDSPNYDPERVAREEAENQAEE